MKKIIKKEKDVLALFLFLFLVYIYFQSHSIYGGDAGDLASAAANFTFAHPPGYPLYSLIASILIKLPFNTPAWRIALISSFSSAMSMAVFYKILKHYFNYLFSLSAALFTSFLYPVFLYSSTVEVFSLNTLFVLTLYWLFLQWYKFGKKIYLAWAVFVFGLSISHHHLFLFSLPAFYFILKKSKLKFSKFILENKKFILLFFLGLLPYLFLPLASKFNISVFYWGNAAKLSGLIGIFTRKMYGTFRAFGGIGEKPIHRLLSVYTFLGYVKLQFFYLGSAFLVLGFLFYLVKKFIKKLKNKENFVLFDSSMILFLSYLFFIFYASFPLTSDFQMATVERFYILPLIFLVPFAYLGLSKFFLFLKNKVKNPYLGKLLTIISLLFLFLLPLTNFINNFYKIYVLKHDQTAENLGLDVLVDLPKDSVLILSADTIIFDTQYVHYALKERPDVFILHSGFVREPDYLKAVAKSRPDLDLSLAPAEDDPMVSFIDKNIKKAPILTAAQKDLELDGYKQIPHGLLWRFYEYDSTPSAQSSFELNLSLVNKFQDLKESSLSKYQNLFLTDVKNFYIGTHQKIIEYYIDLNRADLASVFMPKYMKLVKEDDFLTQIYWGEINLQKKECEAAENFFQTAKEIYPESPYPDAFLRQTYLNCYQDEKKASEFLDSCFSKEDFQDVPL